MAGWNFNDWWEWFFFQPVHLWLCCPMICFSLHGLRTGDQEKFLKVTHMTFNAVIDQTKWNQRERLKKKRFPQVLVFLACKKFTTLKRLSVDDVGQVPPKIDWRLTRLSFIKRNGSSNDQNKMDFPRKLFILHLIYDTNSLMSNYLCKICLIISTFCLQSMWSARALLLKYYSSSYSYVPFMII